MLQYFRNIQCVPKVWMQLNHTLDAWHAVPGLYRQAELNFFNVIAYYLWKIGISLAKNMKLGLKYFCSRFLCFNFPCLIFLFVMQNFGGSMKETLIILCVVIFIELFFIKISKLLKKEQRNLYYIRQTYILYAKETELAKKCGISFKKILPWKWLSMLHVERQSYAY